VEQSLLIRRKQGPVMFRLRHKRKQTDRQKEIY
jgi:hypothetical protein